ncbi:MAG: hypothetical protein IPI73_26095 [Betaproteobacteria bacterium]|nr:hypothetical protein [Betaproteobacteria bacterium]
MMNNAVSGTLLLARSPTPKVAAAAWPYVGSATGNSMRAAPTRPAASSASASSTYRPSHGVPGAGRGNAQDPRYAPAPGAAIAVSGWYGAAGSSALVA